MKLCWLIPLCALASCGPEKAEPQPERPEEPAAIEREPAEQAEARGTIADDGRPEWWFPEVRRHGSELSFCVETIADESLRAAGREAVDVAEDRARIECERAGYTFRASAMNVDKTWGWPLPQLPGQTRRYAGYALVTIDLAELDAGD
jgi:hypothetical protein